MPKSVWKSVPTIPGSDVDDEFKMNETSDLSKFSKNGNLEKEIWENRRLIEEMHLFVHDKFEDLINEIRSNKVDNKKENNYVNIN